MAPASGAGLPSVLEETATLGTFLEQIIKKASQKGDIFEDQKGLKTQNNHNIFSEQN